MNANAVIFDVQNQFKPLPKAFNKKKFLLSYGVVNDPFLSEIQNFSKKQCLGRDPWPEIKNVNAWMISAETAHFMKMGGLGMVASELPEVFNEVFASNGDEISVLTPLYLGNTGKKKTLFNGENIYLGSENKEINLQKIMTLIVPFFCE